MLDFYFDLDVAFKKLIKYVKLPGKFVTISYFFAVEKYKNNYFLNSQKTKNVKLEMPPQKDLSIIFWVNIKVFFVSIENNLQQKSSLTYFVISSN